jgi:hypothetical protein
MWLPGLILLPYQFNSMNKSIQTEIVINATKENVWNILTDFPSFPSWNPFIVSIKGEVKPGTKLINTLKNNGRTIVFKPMVGKVINNRYFDWVGHLFFKGLFDGHHYFEIEELANGQVKLIQGEQFSGLLSSYLLKKIGSDTRNNFISMNGAIKTRAEAVIKNIPPVL